MGVGNAKGIAKRRKASKVKARKKSTSTRETLAKSREISRGRAKSKKSKTRPSASKAVKKAVKRKGRKREPLADQREEQMRAMVVATCEILSDEYSCETSIFRDRGGVIDAEVKITGSFDAELLLEELMGSVPWRGNLGIWVNVVFWVLLHSEEIAQRYEGPLRGLAPISTYPTKDFGTNMLTARFNLEPNISEDYKIRAVAIRFNWNPANEQPDRM